MGLTLDWPLDLSEPMVEAFAVHALRRVGLRFRVSPKSTTLEGSGIFGGARFLEFRSRESGVLRVRGISQVYHTPCRRAWQTHKDEANRTETQCVRHHSSKSRHHVALP